MNRFGAIPPNKFPILSILKSVFKSQKTEIINQFKLYYLLFTVYCLLFTDYWLLITDYWSLLNVVKDLLVKWGSYAERPDSFFIPC